MESDIIKKITPNQLIKLFDNPTLVNIRSYEPTKVKTISKRDFDKAFYYKIRVRHNEKENAKTMLETAIKTLNK